LSAERGIAENDYNIAVTSYVEQEDNREVVEYQAPKLRNISYCI